MSYSNNYLFLHLFIISEQSIGSKSFESKKYLKHNSNNFIAVSANF